MRNNYQLGHHDGLCGKPCRLPNCREAGMYEEGWHDGNTERTAANPKRDLQKPGFVGVYCWCGTDGTIPQAKGRYSRPGNGYLARNPSHPIVCIARVRLLRPDPTYPEWNLTDTVAWEALDLDNGQTIRVLCGWLRERAESVAGALLQEIDWFRKHKYRLQVFTANLAHLIATDKADGHETDLGPITPEDADNKHIKRIGRHLEIMPEVIHHRLRDGEQVETTFGLYRLEAKP